MDFSFDFSSLEFDFSGKKKQEEADEVGEFLRSAKVNRDSAGHSMSLYVLLTRRSARSTARRDS